MITLSTEKKLALKISLIAFAVLILILGSIILSSFFYGWNRAYNEFAGEQRNFDGEHGVMSSFSWEIPLWLPDQLLLWNWPKKWPRDIIIFDKEGNVVRNEIIELTDGIKEELFSVQENIGKWGQKKYLWEKVFLVNKKTMNDYTIFLLHDLTPIIDYYEDLVIIGIIGSILGFLIIFLMANHLAKITIAPIREHNKELEAYSHNVAHELRTPLAVMRQNLELLKIKPSERLIHSTDEEIGGMERIIDTLLFLATPKNHKLDKENINISNYLKEVIKSYPTEIVLDIPKKSIHKTIHVEFFKRIIDNLITNAIKYKSEWKIHVHVHEKWITFSNSIEHDMTEEEVTKLTKAFYQWNDSRHDSGYWLGLALVNKIVEIEGWRMRIATKNKTFSIEILF